MSFHNTPALHHKVGHNLLQFLSEISQHALANTALGFFLVKCHHLGFKRNQRVLLAISGTLLSVGQSPSPPSLQSLICQQHWTMAPSDVTHLTPLTVRQAHCLRHNSAPLCLLARTCQRLVMPAFCPGFFSFLLSMSHDNMRLSLSFKPTRLTLPNPLILWPSQGPMYIVQIKQGVILK